MGEIINKETAKTAEALDKIGIVKLTEMFPNDQELGKYIRRFVENTKKFINTTSSKSIS